MVEQEIHNSTQLKEWGFTLTQDGGETYFQRVLDIFNYIDSPFLYTKKIRGGKYEVYLWGKKEALTVEEIVEIIDQYNKED